MRNQPLVVVRMAVLITRRIASALGLVLVCASPVLAQGRVELAVSDSVSAHEFVRILNEADVQDLDSIAPERASVSLHLYRVAEQGSCIPETHMICNYRYYLAVSDFGEYPDQAVFGLGEVGEIRSIKWLPTDGWGTALLQIEVSNYPEYAYARNPDLVRVTKSFELVVSVDGVEVREVGSAS